MRDQKQFNEILHDCLERILVGGEAIEQCLAQYPDMAHELEPLLKVAIMTRKATRIEPRPEFRARARYQFSAALREKKEAKRSVGFFRWQPRWATVALTAVVAFVLVGSGTVAAASNSMPDEPLYPVKLATETVRVTFTPSALGKAELYLKLADKRVMEMVHMADKGKSEKVERVAIRLNAHLVRIAKLAEVSPEEAVVMMSPAPETAPPMMMAKEAPATAPSIEPAPVPAPVLAPVPSPMPAPTPVPMPVPAPTLAPAPRPAPVIRTAPAISATEAPALEVVPPEAMRPSPDARQKGRGGENDEKESRRAKLKVIIAQKAITHPETLKAALRKAPERMKPALHRAVEETDDGYEKALRAMD